MRASGTAHTTCVRPTPQPCALSIKSAHDRRPNLRKAPKNERKFFQIRPDSHKSFCAPPNDRTKVRTILPHPAALAAATPAGWQDHAETEDRAIATARYKSFARDKGTRLIERTERVLVEGVVRRGKK